MNRYILMYKGEGVKPAKDLRLLRDLPHTTIIDDSPSRMVLVKAPVAQLRTFVDSLPQWDITPARVYTVPGMRPRLLRRPRLQGSAEGVILRRKAARQRLSAKSEPAASSE
jgi:hypothetical protein